MNTLPITNIKFAGKYPQPYLTKKAIKQAGEAIDTKNSSHNILFDNSYKIKTTIHSADDYLKSIGITYCKIKDDVLSIACGYNNGFYMLRPKFKLTEDIAKAYLANSMETKSVLLGGLPNYIDLVKKYKRQDIIQKGLKLHTYELNCDVTPSQKVDAAYNLSKYTKKKIDKNNLFYIENEAFYYDKYAEKVYSVNLFSRETRNTQPVFRTCEFKKDEKGNTIGYKVNDYNFYYTAKEDFEYIEQQTPSEKLKPILNYENNKLFAEGFRFGNAEATQKETIGKESAIKFLKTKLKLYNVKPDDIKVVRYKDKNNDINTRLSFYDPTIGRSFVYDKNGKYLYQLEYNKNPNGEITSCTRI